MDDWQKWRKLQRANLVARREAIAEKDRIFWSAAITLLLQQGFTILKKEVSSVLTIRFVANMTHVQQWIISKNMAPHLQYLK